MVFDFFFTDVDLTVKPGRTDKVDEVDTLPLGAMATTENVYEVPFFKPIIVHVVSVVVHVAPPGVDVTL